MPDRGGVEAPALVLHVAGNRIGYEAGHIPGAYWFDRSWVYGDWKGKSAGGMYPEGLSELFSPRRFGGDRPAVVYDWGDAQEACRAAIALRLSGWTRVSVLQGGLSAWIQEGYSISEGLGSDFESLETPAAEQPLDRPAGLNIPAGVDPQSRQDPPPVRISTMEEVQQALIRQDTRIIDVRSAEEFEAGSIPGAVHREWSEALDTQGILLAPEPVLTRVWDPLVKDFPRVILYCRSAMRAAHSAWLLAHRYPEQEIYLYDGSWREWSRRQV